MRRIAGLENLQTLGLSCDRLTAAGIGHLKAARRLENLCLTGCRGLDDDSLAAVGQLSQLHSLQLHDTLTSDIGLPHLNGLTELRRLVLFNHQYTGAGLASLSGLGELTDLHMEGERVSNALLAALRQFPKLKHLHTGAGKNTDKPGITDEGLTQIGEAPSLLTINFQGTGITTAGMAALDALPRLQSVFIIQSPGCSEANWNAQSRRLDRAAEARAANPQSQALRQDTMVLLNDAGFVFSGSGYNRDQLSASVFEMKGGDRTLALLERLGGISELRQRQ